MSFLGELMLELEKITVNAMKTAKIVMTSRDHILERLASRTSISLGCAITTYKVTRERELERETCMKGFCAI
jgi:hypothetical protein